MYSELGKTVITHNGVFHADEVFACALIKSFISNEVEILRTRDKVLIDEAIRSKFTYVLDIGGIYCENDLNFDHHQDSINIASNVMVAYFIRKHKPEMVDVIDRLCAKIMVGISDWDTNHNNIINKWHDVAKHHVNLSMIISSFNRNPMDIRMQDLQFEKAVDFACTIIDNYLYIIGEEIKADKIYNSRKVINDCVAVFDEFCPIWKEKDEFIWAIQPNPQGWALMSANSSKYPLPEIEHKDLIFAHQGKFIAVFKTKEAAIEVASTL